MEQTIFEKNGGSYVEMGDYFLPTITISENKDERPIGVWGQRRRRYLKTQHRVIYYNLLTGCKLHEHLTDVNKQAEELFSRLVKELAEKEGVNEKRKAENQMLWVQRMNNIRNRAMEIVNAEIIFA